MVYTDRILNCADCGIEFVFSAGDQQFYAERQFSEPRRCPSCRALRKAQRNDGAGSGSYGGYGDRVSRGPREMHSATCANCGKEALVPFRPTGARPVYCSDCFQQMRG